MLAATLTTTTARPARAPMPIAPTTMTTPSRRRWKFWKQARHAREADADRVPPARERERANDFGARRQDPFGRIHGQVENPMDCVYQKFARARALLLHA
eukprot:7399246-Pyramimonas_sp.AAC.1